jgi:hypothetical protein
MSDERSEFEVIYELAANGDADAFRFLVRWHLWCHAIDDHIDEARPQIEVVGVCQAAAEVFASPYFQRRSEVLVPVVMSVAEKYRMSVLYAKSLDGLRFSGNDMVLVVAAMQGGIALVRSVSDRLWPAVIRTQVTDTK